MKEAIMHRYAEIITSVFLLATFAASAPAAESAGPAGALKWYKGNTHTHTWWSDGDSPPELVVKWYKEHGYNFLALSDHNILSEGEKWIEPKGARQEAAKMYEETFPAEWIVKRESEGKVEYRLKPLNEFRALFEESGKFLMIQAEEISDSFEKKPIHVNGVNLKEVVPPPHGSTLAETLQNNINAVLEQRRRTGQPMFPHVNHPNFGWALEPEHLYKLEGEQFFEVFNGHPSVHNAGDETHVSTERMWDIILAKRLGDLDLPVMYGVATDDAHGYTAYHGKAANPGRGWVVVRSRFLTPEHIVMAMERGDFYASTGVTLKDVRFDNNTLAIDIQPESDVQYTTQFIGTKRDYQRVSADRHDNPEQILQPKHSDEIGIILDEQSGLHPGYKLTGKELYVRAKVISTKKHGNPIENFDVEVAWVQPVLPQ
jgi:hypothetical protein